MSVATDRVSATRNLPRLVVFDWDGTLRDSVSSIVGCAQTALADVGLATTRAAVLGTIGLSLEQSVERWIAAGAAALDPDGIAHVVARYRHHWIAHWHAEGALFPEVPDLLVELTKRGHLLAIATGKSRSGLMRDLARPDASGVREQFVSLRTADDAAAKPSPEMLFSLMDELGAAREETAMIGDTHHDLEMARNAGVLAIAVASGALSRARLEPLADWCLERVSDLGKARVLPSRIP